MTYLDFLLLFVVAPILVMATFLRAKHRSWDADQIPLGAFIKATGVLVVLAVTYTTPWDNYLVKHQIWWYGPERVLGTIGYVPIEEYAFFVLQTVMTCLWGYGCYRVRYQLMGSMALTKAPGKLTWPLSALIKSTDWPAVATDCWPTGDPAQCAPSAAKRSGAFYGVLAGYLIALAIGLYGLLWAADSWRYLGLILSWAVPIMLLQWWLGGEHLLANKKFFALMFWPPTIYLWLADGFAIHDGIWTISEAFTLGISAGPLPLEEAVFFAVTNLMVTQGLILFVLLLPFGRKAAEDPVDLRKPASQGA